MYVKMEGNMYSNNSCSSSQLMGSTRPDTTVPSESDELSLFLHQILRRSSTHTEQENQSGSVPLSGSAVGDYFPGNVSSSGGTIDNDVDEYDCESEEGLEALIEETPANKPNIPSRSSSKRSRAAEVHNLSEKRRRSRINEKMKALQNLIPNSNKTDKASMLDEAIEYLKQLQLQVQMLSMRNGISLHPMCLPRMPHPILSQTRTNFGERSNSLPMDIASTLPMNQETPTQSNFSLSEQCTSLNQPLHANVSRFISSETTLGLDTSLQDHFGHFQLHSSSEYPFSVDARESQVKDSDTLEVSIKGKRPA